VTLVAIFLFPISLGFMANKKLNTCAAVIFSTGTGEDFPSRTPLIMQPLSGQPLILSALNSAREATGNIVTLILDQEYELLLDDIDSKVNIVIQPEQHNFIQALVQSEHMLRGSADHLLLVRADMPLLTASTLEELIAVHLAQDSSSRSQPVMTVASLITSGSHSHNRIIRGDDGRITRILDEGQTTDNPQEEAEYDAGIYCLSADWLWETISELPDSARRDSQLSDLVQLASSAGLPVLSLTVKDPDEVLRIDSLFQLSQAETILRKRTNHDLMRGGVTIIDPNTTYIDPRVTIGQDTVIHPNTYLRGLTHIGQACQIGPNSMITDTEIGDRCEITFSVTENAILEDDVDIGPFAHLRKGAHLAQGVHMGNYGEVKNSYLGPGTKMGHFSYIGDSKIGPDVNIGAGVITANYDGRSKHLTEIGAGAFIGSDTMLIAPLKIGAGARTGAGSVVTKDVPPNSLAVGIPARVIRKEENDGS